MVLRRRRFAQVSSSDGEDDFVAETESQGQNSRRPAEKMEGKRRKRKKDGDKTLLKELKPDDVKPVGEPIKVTGRGRRRGRRRTHYGKFKYNGKRYKLEDTVLVCPEKESQRPYVAIIKDITKNQDESMMILGQWFYREEEAEKKGGGNWKVNHTRELFYSFHRNEVPVKSVMHKCVVNFVPPHKQIPKRTDNRGFIVRKLYDTVEKKLWKLTDKRYEDAQQHELDMFVEKSMLRLGDLPDLETEEDVETAKRSSREVY
ncbi:unnamed protein product [Eruca vesicaria subsp. sativa]|uniref:BAH domain-containing protein n=1 Tax=Eruca vesicaria subsp. sativa TaxID=29727 RepID=A0ABC8LIR3_ERUVS|nr:unnamed protein product [Eruca vesicaria subsp. sativa]